MFQIIGLPIWMEITGYNIQTELNFSNFFFKAHLCINPLHLLLQFPVQLINHLTWKSARTTLWFGITTSIIQDYKLLTQIKHWKELSEWWWQVLKIYILNMFLEYHEAIQCPVWIKFKTVFNVYDCYNDELLIINYFERVCRCSFEHRIIAFPTHPLFPYSKSRYTCHIECPRYLG